MTSCHKGRAWIFEEESHWMFADLPRKQKVVGCKIGGKRFYINGVGKLYWDLLTCGKILLNKDFNFNC